MVHFIQIGGSDQWGNIAAGCDLVRRLREQTVYGLTLPLLTTAGGEKMGKSAGNALWLDPTLTSPFTLYQYFLNLTDQDALQLLPLLTLLGDAQVEHVRVSHAAAPNERAAHRALALGVGSEGVSMAKCIVNRGKEYMESFTFCSTKDSLTHSHTAVVDYR